MAGPGKNRRAGSNDNMLYDSHDSESDNSSDGMEIDDTGMVDNQSGVQPDTTTTNKRRLDPFEAEEYDMKIAEWVHQGYSLVEIPEKLKEHHNVEWGLRVVEGRYKAWRQANRQIMEAALDAQIDDWHVGEDDELLNAEHLVQSRIEVEIERLLAKKWTEVARSLALNPVHKCRSARAVKERFEAVQSGKYLQPIENDPDPESRAASMQEQRLHYREELQLLMAQSKLDVQARRDKYLADQAASKAVKALRDLDRAHRTAVAQQKSRDLKWRQSLYNREAMAGDWQHQKRDHDEALLDRVGSQMIQDERVRRTTRGARTASSLVNRTSHSTLVEVTAVTRASPRMAMTDSQLDALLASRKLQRRGPDEGHEHVVARIAAADDELSQAALARLLQAAFCKNIRGDRTGNMRRLAEADATLD